MKPAHLEFLKVLDPSSRPNPRYTLAELQNALRMNSRIESVGHDRAIQWFAFLSASSALILAPYVIKIVDVPWLAMAASAGIATGCTMLARRISRRLKDWVYDKKR